MTYKDVLGTLKTRTACGNPVAHWRTSFGGTTPWATIGNSGVAEMSWFHFADMNGDRMDDVVLLPPGRRFLVSHSGTSPWTV